MISFFQENLSLSEEERSFLVKVSDKVEKKRDSAKQKLAGLNNALKLVNERYSQDITKIIQSDNKAEGLNHQQKKKQSLQLKRNV